LSGRQTRFGSGGSHTDEVQKAEEILLGNPIDDTQIEKASKIAAEEAKPISDVRASDTYRREMIEVLTRKAIREA
jgi:carbon-monoxide dehydrogenase medium subunit